MILYSNLRNWTVDWMWVWGVWSPNRIQSFFSISGAFSLFSFLCMFFRLWKTEFVCRFFACRLTARKTNDSKSGLTSTSEIELARTSNLPTAQAAWPWVPHRQRTLARAWEVEREMAQGCNIDVHFTTHEEMKVDAVDLAGLFQTHKSLKCDMHQGCVVWEWVEWQLWGGELWRFNLL